MEAWRRVFRIGLAPILSIEGLEALAKALREDSPQLIQGATSSPPPLECCMTWDVEGACLIGLAYWLGDGLVTVEEVCEAFNRTCDAIDRAMGEPAAVRYLLCFFDDTPRMTMRGDLLPEVERAIAQRMELLATQEDEASV